MKPIKNFLFFSCKKATEIIEKSKIERLSPLENSRLKIHLSMCKSCQEYSHASDHLDEQWLKMLQVQSQESEAKKKQKLIEMLKTNEK